MMELSKRFETFSLLQQVMAVLLGCLLITAGAYIEVPMWPVPMTMQTLAILLIGAVYTPSLAFVTTMAYLLQGAAGLPVFSGGAGGPAHLLGPTGGYLIGFIVAACSLSLLVRYVLARKSALQMGLAMLVAHGFIFVPGVSWLSLFIGTAEAFYSGFLIFIPGMIFKTVLALAIIKAVDKA